MKIVLLSGFKKSGKDTSADYVLEKLEKKGVNAKKFALANKLKQSCAKACAKEIKSTVRDIKIDAFFYYLYFMGACVSSLHLLMVADHPINKPVAFAALAFAIGVVFARKKLDLHRLLKTKDLSPINWTADQDLKELDFNYPLLLTEDKLEQICGEFSVGTELANRHIGKTLRSMREVLQFVGTEVLRDYGQDIHCEALEVQLKDESDVEVAIITDCRFLNEREYFEGAPLVFIERPAVEPELTPDLHRSEAEMFDIKKMDSVKVVKNTGTLEELYEKLEKELLNELA